MILPLPEPLLRAMMPNAGTRLTAHLRYINPALEEGKINTPPLVAAFMAQLAHESGEYRYMEELASGQAYDIEVNPAKAMELGNTAPGDGVKFKGHGPMQITGRANHKACGEALGLNLIDRPLLITLPEYGTRAAVWFWNDKAGGLSPIAARGWFKTVSRMINGGYNGLSDRIQYWDRNRALLGLNPINTDGERQRIKDFQLSRGLEADGEVGPKTLFALKQEMISV